MARKGVTLIELIMVMALIIAISGPIWQTFKRGTKTTLKGLVQIETTLEARRIIRQIHSDLKCLCFPPENLPELDGLTRQQIDERWNQIIVEGGTKAFPTYSFWSFPVHSTIDEAVSANSPDIAYRKPRLITYRLEAIPDAVIPLSRLIREENGKVRVVSDRIVARYFSIEKPGDSAKMRSIWVRLQLSAPVAGYSAKNARNFEKNIMIADFFDVVTPDFHNAIFGHPTVFPSWHSPLNGPPLTP